MMNWMINLSSPSIFGFIKNKKKREEFAAPKNIVGIRYRKEKKEKEDG